MTPMTALPARAADLSVQGAPRPGRAATTREDLARSRDDFARTLERESSVPDRTTARTDRAADRGAERSADRPGSRPTDRAAGSPVGKAVRAAERAAALAGDGTANEQATDASATAVVAAPVDPAAAALVATLGLALPDAGGAPPAGAEPVAAAPDTAGTTTSEQAGESSTALTGAALADAALAASTVAAQVAQSAVAAQAVPSAPSGQAIAPVLAAAASATSAIAATPLADEAAAGAGAGSPGSTDEAAAPLVVDGSRVVVVGASGPSGGRPGDAQSDGRGAARTAVPLTEGAAAADGAAVPSADVVAGRVDAPTQAPTTSPAQSFAQVLTGAVDRAAATQAPATPANTPHVPLAEQVRGPLVALKTAAPGEHMLTLRVDPEHLGPVQVRAHIGADGIRIELIGATDAARDSLRGLLTDLRRDLSATGMNATLSLASDTAGQQGRNPAGAADLFGGQAGTSGQPGSRGTGDSPGAAATTTDPTTDLRSTTATTHGAHGVDVLI